MPALNRLTFTAGLSEETGGTRPSLILTPFVDDVSLVALATEFENRCGFEPAGGYAGLKPGSFRFGDLRRYFLGAEDDQWPRSEHMWVLICECGEAGCHPLTARVIADADTVTWTDFAEENHLDRDYTGFGPFVFARDQYEQSIAWAADRAEAHAG